MQGESNRDGSGQENVARLVGLLRHERPASDHWLGLSRAVRFRVEQERAGREADPQTAPRRVWARWREAIRLGGWDRWLEPSAWVPTVLAVVAIGAWLLPTPPNTVPAMNGSHLAGFGEVPELGAGIGPFLGQGRPKVAPIVGLHLRIIYLDSDQLPEGFVAFPPLPNGGQEPRR